mmetsp:Transcript_33527/g.60102  ORF Transcript_33527/g.60102 Transcript_33527/m.60102 type:complete len:113 (-) Transcript_33527:70-408(-)
MASNALEMESQWLGQARDHDELFVDDCYEAATDNEESEVSEDQLLHFLVGSGSPTATLFAGGWWPKCCIFCRGLRGPNCIFPSFVVSPAYGRGWMKGMRDIILTGQNSIMRA